MAKRYYCNRPIRHRGEWLQPGDELVVESFMKIGPWVRAGHVRVVDDGAPPVKRPVVTVDLGGLKKAELVAMVGERGRSLDDITGTGSGGSVTKKDLVKFLGRS
jgi:hypothetical protein